MLQINLAIVHEIPKGRYVADSGVDVGLSNAVTELAPETRRFIEENILSFALKSPRAITEDVDAGSTTPNLVRALLASPNDFVVTSQEVAKNLYRAQTGNSPSGVLIVAAVTKDGVESVVILKAEHAEGMRLTRVGGTGGHFDLQHLNELIVGNNARIYKIAVIHVIEGAIIGEMVDQQNGKSFADFFMSTFLGCRLADNSEVQTKQFMNSAMDWVNEAVPKAESRARYATALIAYMNAPADTFQATEFADTYLDPEHRDDFIGAIPDEISNNVISKAMKLVPGNGEGLRMYGSGVVISASAEALKSGALEVLSEESDSTTIRVRGSLQRYGLGVAPKYQR